MKTIRDEAGHASNPGWVTAVFLSLACFSLSLRADDFVRGDANNDGFVSIADSHFLLSGLFRGRGFPSCGDAGDADDNGGLDISDSVKVLGFLVLELPVPPSPFPEPGPDPTEDELDQALPCDDYGSGSPLADPAAKLTVLDVGTGGGNDGHAVIGIALSSSTKLGGYYGKIRDPSGVIQAFKSPYGSQLVDLTGTYTLGFKGASMADGVLTFGFLANFTEKNAPTIPAGNDIPVLEIGVCLLPGTRAGDYPLTLEAGELVDDATGRAIAPALESGILTVETDVEDTECVLDPSQPIPESVIFYLGDATGVPGGAVTVPFSVRSSMASQGFSYSIDFDEGVLGYASTERLWERPGGTPYQFEKFEANTQDANPGSGGLDEGFVVGAAIISLTDSSSVLPPRSKVEVLNFHFTVNAAASTGVSTELGFLDGGRVSEGPVANKLISGGKDVTPTTVDSFVFVNGRVNIVPDVTTFVRGDSNADGTIDLSDALTTLNYIFLGHGPPACYDAADANDDGLLDLSDAVAMLNFLFLGAAALPPPTTLGEDPTADGLRCLTRE